ncbi:MAG: exodeoxyribonuclease VII large subunit [Gammaproteobacteria bacterium]
MPLLIPDRPIYTVSKLNAAVRALLEGEFALIWLEGEISNLARPASGHLYFSLKDSTAQIRCALFRNRSQALDTSRIANGQQVLVRARVSLYEPRGDYQLIVEHLEDAGEGMLRRAFEALKAKLAAEGLFDSERKRPLPRFPTRIGVITSPSGAAIRDVLSVLRRRFPALPVLLYPVQVQGETAAAEIVQALQLASARRDCEVLLLVRGGGSLEDLQAFNTEIVARAIHASAIPVVSGVGHEIDFTIADFVADLRAPTPSAAAELASPDRAEWLERVHRLEARLASAFRGRFDQRRQRLDWLAQHLARLRPDRRLQALMQRTDEWEQRLRQALRHALSQRRQRLAELSRALHGVSPLQTLARGYAVVRRYPQGELLRSAAQTQPGERIEAQLGEGRLICQVEEIKPS